MYNRWYVRGRLKSFSLEVMVSELNIALHLHLEVQEGDAACGSEKRLPRKSSSTTIIGRTCNTLNDIDQCLLEY